MTVQDVLTGEVHETAAHLEPSGNELRARRRIPLGAFNVGLELRRAFIPLCTGTGRDRYLLTSGDGKSVPPDKWSFRLPRRAGLEGARVVRVHIAWTALGGGLRTVGFEELYYLEGI